MNRRYILSIAFFCILFMSLYGSDNSQWRGSTRDGIYQGEDLLEVWPESGPQILWSVEDLGSGYSSPAVTNDRVYLTGLEGNKGYVHAFDMDGKRLWKSEYGREWTGSFPGVRTTPALYDNRLYVLSGHGKIVCLNPTNGNPLWSVDLMKTFKAPNIEWGFNESVVVFDDKVICSTGGPQAAMVALDRKTGSTLWKSKSIGETTAYCSPLLVDHGGRKLLVTMMQRCIIGVDANTGEYLWRHSHTTEYDIHANTPIYYNGRLFAFSGYGTGSVMLELSADGSSVSEVWRNAIPDNQMGGAVLINGYLYLSVHNNRGWHCVDWNTGEVKYSARKLGHRGAIVTADGILYVYSDRGDVGLVKPDPTSFQEISSFRLTAGSGEHWAHPVISEGRLYLRHGNALLVFNISK